MIIKKFQASSEAEAITKAKTELGSDAIVMNIKKVKKKGISRFFKSPIVEVTAAVDDKTQQDVAKPQALKKDINMGFQSQLVNVSQEAVKRGDVLIDEQDNPKFSNSSSAIEEKLNALQGLLEKQISEKEEKVEEKVIIKHSVMDIPCVKLCIDQLTHNEVTKEYANQLILELENVLQNDASVDKVLANIYQKIILKLGKPSFITPSEGKTKYIFFIGPTGVGKTTTIAKIASTMKLNEKAKIGLVTSDTYRIAAVEQLRTYANILQVPLKVIYNAKEMDEVKELYQDYDLVLVDTAGRSHKNKEQCDDIQKIINLVPEEDREVYLVLSATTKYRDLTKIVETYNQISDYSIIFTKLDETSCLGNILNIKMLTNAPLSYTTWGQNVPDDIGRINPQEIAKQLLGGNE